MRSPKYLDVPLLRTMADYYDIPVPHDAQITRKVVESTDRGVGFDKVAKGHRDRTASEEVTEIYQSELRPVKLFNDIIDELVVSGRACDLTQDPGQQLIHRSPVLFEGELELAPASEIGELLGKFLPLMLDALARGQTDFRPSNEQLAQQFFHGSHESVPQVMKAEVEGASSDFYMILKADHYLDSSSDDLVGDMAIFGLAERIIREGSSYSLEKFLVPGLNRSMRRMMGADGLEKMISGAPQIANRTVSAEDLNIRGPAVLVNVAGIFT
ncbi:hypothetical protein K1T35_13200 [Pseudonocardia sp. DSM 110487]|uniref:DUF6414 family protein n=1 Tax=Pseudonocardia sp. DSM 110487 TaxID=2865833 RepID=UPI001C6965C0|nr:hypothetical protein [Pseudonocardia sp. DSM 110487]QYN38099.1 hypothetical protein K1T35_13200 [Pseudonocardia sp. DSM 110487]